MRFAHALALSVAALCACNGAGASTPMVSSSAMLDAYDALVLDHTEADAPTFAEAGAIGDPPDDTPRRFRAWLGWGAPTCEPCPWDQAATCVPRCRPGEPFVCARPARTLACGPDETISTRVGNGGEPVPAEGVYVFEGRWSEPGPAFAVERIAPVHLPAEGGT